jgi:hypothetical protein
VKIGNCYEPRNRDGSDQTQEDACLGITFPDCSIPPTHTLRYFSNEGLTKRCLV